MNVPQHLSGVHNECPNSGTFGTNSKQLESIKNDSSLCALKKYLEDTKIMLTKWSRQLSINMSTSKEMVAKYKQLEQTKKKDNETHYRWRNKVKSEYNPL